MLGNKGNHAMLDRRSLLTAAALAALAARAGAAPLAGAGAVPMTARLQPVTDDYFGTKVTDDYRWMENPDDPDWLPFLKSQNAFTRARLDAIPGRAALGQRISALTGDAAVTRKVDSAGDQLFYEQRPAGADNFKLFVRTRGGAPRVLIDPTAMKDGAAHVSLDWWEPSHDGALIAYGLSPAGSEASVLHVMEVATGRQFPEAIPFTDFGIVSWLPDGSGFFYLALTGKRGTSGYYQNSETRLHRIGSNVARDPVVFRRGLYKAIPVEPVQIPVIAAVQGTDRVLAILADVRPERAMWSASLADLLAGKPDWRPVAGFGDLVVAIANQGDDLYLLSNRGNDRGRVVVTSLARPDFAAARQVVAEGPTVLEDLSGAHDGVYVTIMDGGVQRLGRIAGGAMAPIPLPFEGAISGAFTNPLKDGAYLLMAGWLNPSGIWFADGRTVTDTGITPKPPIDTSPYETRRGFAAAKDGAQIPYTLIARKGWAANGANPVLATGYGAYQYSSTPRFSPALLPFLDAGGVFVNANVRGGGEYGRPWHKAGQKATKVNTWRDLIAVCEKLVADKVTAPAHLAIQGTSAGGITVGMAMAERPDLFAAVIDDVGWTNPIRYSAEQNVADIDEWGPAVDAASWRIMYAMDAYNHLKAGTRYPAVLAITGATDPRVAPWHITKFAAKLQAIAAKMPDPNPVLLRIDFDAGHGIGSTRSQRDALAADIYSFVLWRTGAKGWAPV